MSTITVEVTHKDIRNGTRCSSQHCPIAIALRRALQLQRISVGSGMCSAYTAKQIGSGQLPDVAKDLINAFDNGNKVKPITFELLFNWQPRFEEVDSHASRPCDGDA